MAKFKARARTVDMLGRQQIAGSATAISELFKNAHDAYASRVEVDYYRPSNLFLLRDNGIGMTSKEFEERWLTLGTESKVKGSVPPYKPPNEHQRPVMGEKGIGRLAIARIGPQVLVLSRAKRGDDLHDLVVALINWELFELPGINLDEIEIPLEICPGGDIPDRALIERLQSRLLDSIKGLEARVNREKIRSIERNIRQFAADPQRIDSFFNSGDALEPGHQFLSLKNGGWGTHFIIQPADKFLSEEIDSDAKSNADPIFTKFLVGFANTMVPNRPPPKIETKFRDWKTAETASELIGGGAFVNSEDFLNADHRFTGRFDEFGQFTGEVTIFDQSPITHTIPWEESQGNPTLCGPFTVDIAYLQGDARYSKVPIELFNPLRAKLERFGGIYIYRDGIRVLPYGNTEFDWLNIDTRRNKGQSYYFFAYRRMFGAIELTNSDNFNLVEKAGREGFQTNAAYRQLQRILENFFINLAADFFRETGAKAAVWIDRRKELEREELARRKRESTVSKRKKDFEQSLETFFEAVESNKPEQDVEILFKEVQSALESAAKDPNPDNAASLLIEAEGYSEHLLADLRKKYTIAKPRDIGFSTKTRREWEAYLVEQNRVANSIFIPASERLKKTIGQAAEQARLHIDQRKRLKDLIDVLVEEVERDLRQNSSVVKKIAEEKQNEIQRIVKHALREVNDAIQSVRADLSRKDLSRIDSNTADAFRDELESRINDAAFRHKKILDNARQQLFEINLGSYDPEFISQAEVTGALESELLALKEANEADAELVQLGMALAVVNHEFDAVIRSVRDELRRLKGWAKATPQLRPIYERINNNFEHLDGYLTLFTPLQRRLYRTPILIKGKDISKFIQDLFGERLKRHSVTLKIDPSFDNVSVTGYPSTFYPVFVNIVDNAIFWLQSIRAERILELGSKGSKFLISNNGPEITARDQQAIFEPRFSRKPAGRGLGLYISKTTLEKAGYSLSLTQSTTYPVCFMIGENSKDLNS